MKLDLGAGLEKQEGWTTLDINPDSGADLIEDATCLGSIPSGSCSHIRAVHLIEHLYHFQVAPTLQLWFSKLDSGGVLTLYIPDVRTEMERFLLQDRNPDRFFAIVYGKQWSPDPHAVHKTAFWPERIQELLTQAGFRHIRRIPPRYDTEFGITARKPVKVYPTEET
jgi:predicted SAM-dependent methyltransferase